MPSKLLYTASFLVTTVTGQHHFTYVVRSERSAWKCLQGDLQLLLRQAEHARQVEQTSLLFITNVELLSLG